MKTKLFIALLFFISGTIYLSAQDGSAVQTSPDGIKYKTLKEGSGATPTDGKETYFHIEVYSQDGNKEFTTRDMNVPVHQVIGEDDDSEAKAMYKVMKTMKAGGTYRLEVPKKIMSDSSPAASIDGDHVVYNIELLEVSDARPSGTDMVKEVISTRGTDAGRAKFNELKSDATYVFAEWDMNSAAYGMLQQGKTDAAIELFKMNTELNPTSWNAYDSLGDGYMAKQDKANAKAAYQKALQLNSSYTPTKDKLSKL